DGLGAAIGEAQVGSGWVVDERNLQPEQWILKAVWKGCPSGLMGQLVADQVGEVVAVGETALEVSLIRSRGAARQINEGKGVQSLRGSQVVAGIGQTVAEYENAGERG